MIAYSPMQLANPSSWIFLILLVIARFPMLSMK